MEKTCKNCGQNFSVTDTDKAFYKKMTVPEPTFCPDCRQQRRLIYRNERNFYLRKCDLTGESIVSVYPQDFPGIVYSPESWHGDNWDQLNSGRDFDFNRPFFEQFLKLTLDAPRICVVNSASENCIYTNHSAYNKNCYLCINTGRCEDLFYCSNYNLYDKNCCDCVAIMSCERCYFCTNVRNSQFCSYLYECENMSDCHYCFDCRSCQNCFGCFNLRHKKYHINNQQFTKEEYEKRLAEIMPKKWPQYMEMFKNWKEQMRTEAIHRDLWIENCQNSSGDHLENNKNVTDSFYLFDSEDCHYCYDAGKMRDCYDVTEPFEEELHYEVHASFNGYHNMFCSKCLESRNSQYSQYCFACNDCFGCFGLKRMKYCVFNKQYSEEEYKKLVAKIIEHMKTTKEYGEFFPAAMSPFAYNETVANDYYPLAKERALSKGFKWRDPDTKEFKSSDKDIITCADCGKNFRIIESELKFYKNNNLPIPEKCPDCRFFMRMNLRNPRKIRESACTNCNKKVQTSCLPEIKKIYCEECYLKEVY